MKNHHTLFTALLSFALVSVSCSRYRTEITEKELVSHIKYLSSDPLRGRLTGTPGDSLAADYIREVFLSYGLKPLYKDGFQRFTITDRIIAGKNNSLAIRGKSFTPGEDFIPAAFSGNGSLKAGVIFAGYGFSISNDSVSWNDYRDLDVKGKWVMVLRGDPEPDNISSVYIPFSGDRDKVMTAKDNGAGGVLLVSGPAFEREDIIEPLSGTGYSAGIPVLRIRRIVADEILSGKKVTISDLEKKINTTRKPAGLDTGCEIEAGAEVIQTMAGTRNVAMVLPGSDSVMKKEYVILGAHFDHLGMGGSSSSRVPDTVAVHHGADDNASGVAMLMELAGKFAGTKGSNKRSLVFVAFSGEEKGILGSKYFADNPPFSLSEVNAMVNMDMVGRLKDSREIAIGGIGTAENLRKMIEEHSDTGIFRFVLTEEGSGPSDHSAFYSKSLPVLFISTGAHDDYHKPSDSWDKINYEGMLSVSELVYRIVSRLASDSSKLVFREAGPREVVSRAPRRRGVTLGIMPDFAGAEKRGCRVDLVTPGRPAAIGGMKKGDIITSINGLPVGNIQDYMFRLGQLKRGERITVEVIRDEKKEVLIIQL